MGIEDIVSPCISVCIMNEAGLCAGCYRTVDEISEWWNMSDTERDGVMNTLGEREEAAFG